VNAQRRLCLAVAVSVLAHVSLLAIRPRMPVLSQVPASPPPMTVRILDAEAPPAVASAPRVEVPKAPAARPAPPVRTPRPRIPPEPVAPAPEPETVPAAPVEPPGSVVPPPVDMLAMIEARRERRRAMEEARRRPPPATEQPDAATRNLQTLTGRDGVSGVFSILHKGTRTGSFAFNGWRRDARGQWREVYEVDAGLGGNVELAMVRKMIELIRSHYSGDFHWESYRLGRVVVLSARPEHTREVEDFLMREFFGQPMVNPRAGPAQ